MSPRRKQSGSENKRKSHSFLYFFSNLPLMETWYLYHFKKILQYLSYKWDTNSYGLKWTWASCPARELTMGVLEHFIIYFTRRSALKWPDRTTIKARNLGKLGQTNVEVGFTLSLFFSLLIALNDSFPLGIRQVRNVWGVLKTPQDKNKPCKQWCECLEYPNTLSSNGDNF